MPDRDAHVVEKRDAAGAVMVGKTELYELAYANHLRQSTLWHYSKIPAIRSTSLVDRASAVRPWPSPPVWR